MNKLFISMTVAVTLMGCATNHTNTINHVASEAIEIANSGEQQQIVPNLQSGDNEVVPVEESCQTYNTCIDGNDETSSVLDEAEINEQVDHLQTPDAATIVASVSTADTVTDVDINDYVIVPDQLSVSDESDTDKIIYLTFDDGPSVNTPRILDILKKENVKATFFVTGHHKKFVHLIQREFEEGHAIGAHTYSHKYAIYTSQETYFEDLEKLQAIIEKYTGSRTKLLRFPGGSSNHTYRHYSDDPDFMINLTREVRRRGYQYIDWNLSSKDSSASYVSTSTIISMASRAYKRKICLLMHDTFGKENTVEALPEIIKYYKKKGYRFETLDVNSPGFHHI